MSNATNLILTDDDMKTLLNYNVAVEDVKVNIYFFQAIINCSTMKLKSVY